MNITNLIIRSYLLRILLFCILPSSTGILCAQELIIPQNEKSRGVPAYPFGIEVKQPDGEKITLKSRGDRMLHWYETPNGYSVLKNTKGQYVYAEHDAMGNMVPSAYKVSASKLLPEGIKKGLRYSPSQVSVARKNYYPGPSSKANPNPFPSIGANNVLVVLTQYDDLPSSVTVGEIENLMSESNYNGTGSFRDYYNEVSYGNLVLESTVTPWVQVSRGMRYYGENDEFGYDLRPQELVREAIDSLEAGGFDFSPFDNDGDGYVDEIILMHSGYGEQYIGAGDSAIWSHAFHLGDLSVTYDGVILDNYIICPELYGSSGTTTNSIGTVVHEFAHSLAIPDIYDVDLDGSGGYAFDPNFWDLMAVGSWNNHGRTPAGINAWLKRYMGWMTFPTIDSVGVFTLDPLNEQPDAYQLNTTVYNEYFVVENRQRSGFDSFLPGEGMLIYHVDLNYPGWLTGEINVDPEHQGFDIEEADNIRDTASLGGDPFPGTAGITYFDSLSSPSSNTWAGNSSGVSIQHISQAGDAITFEILDTNFLYIPENWSVDELSYTQLGVVTGLVLNVTDTASAGYLSAFAGEVCRGVTSPTYDSISGLYVFKMNVFSNATSGEQLEFRYYDPLRDTILVLYEKLDFAQDSIAGSESSPFAFHVPVQYIQQFSEGWNWFSLNVEMNDMSPTAVFTTCATPGDYVKNQTNSTSYYEGYGWFGNMNFMNTGDLYLINAGSSCGIDVYGVPVNTAGQQVDIVSGWNWISYTPRAAMSPAEALGSLTPTELDYIKNQTQSATYYDSYGWFGSLNLMGPGDGYMLKMANEDLLVYPAEGSVKKNGLMQARLRQAQPSDAMDGLLEAFDPHEFRFNGTINATVRVDGFAVEDEDGLLTAWSDDQCRGVAGGRYFEPTGGIVFPLMVYSNIEEGDLLTFRYDDPVSKKTYDVTESLRFEKDMVEGNAFNALKMSVSGVSGAGENMAAGISLETYPNPFNEQVNIQFELKNASMVRIEVYDLFGKMIEVIEEDYYPAGFHTIKWSATEQFPLVCIMNLTASGCRIHKRVVHFK